MREEGSTLLELLVVCLVLALIAALSVPVVRVTERLRYLQEVSRVERTPDGKGEWQARPKLVVETHRFYFLLPWAAGEQLVHPFPADVYAISSGAGEDSATVCCFFSSGDPSGKSALGQTVELQSPHYSLDVIIDEAGRVRTERRGQP